MNIADIMRGDQESFEEWVKNNPEQAREWAQRMMSSPLIKESQQQLKQIGERYAAFIAESLKGSLSPIHGLAGRMAEMYSRLGDQRPVFDISQQSLLPPESPKTVELPMVARINELKAILNASDDDVIVRVWIEFGGREYLLIRFENIRGFSADGIVEGFDAPLHLGMAFQYRIETIDPLDSLDEDTIAH